MFHAAGGVVTERPEDGPLRVVVIHRPRHGDWTLPKGKRERDETDEACALREVEEETGLRCRPLRALGETSYRVGSEPKTVRWFELTPASGILVAGDGVDDAHWLALDEARELLTHDGERALLARLESPS